MSELCAYHFGICLSENTHGIEGEMHGDTDGWIGLELSPLRGDCNGTTRYGVQNPWRIHHCQHPSVNQRTGVQLPRMCRSGCFPVCRRGK
jgi:hypothetical protein